MGRGSLFLLYCAMALGQAPPMDPFERAMQASQQARNQGNPAETAARREEAHKLLDQMPADSQQWAGRVQRLAQSYQGAGWHVRARAVVQDALGRATAFPEWHPARVQLLNMLAGFWEQDGNLLKALSYREKAIAAVEATPPGASAEGQSSGLTKGVILAGDFGSARMVNGLFNPGRARGNDNYLYDQLASLYRRLGRPEEAAKTIAKMRSRMQNDAGALANSYAEEGDFDQAVALYRKQAEAAAAKPQAQPWEIAGPLQSIASLYEQQERWTDAAAALQQAATRLDSSGEPAARNSANSIRLRLASLLVRSGQRQSAEDLYQSLLHLTANDHPDQALPVIQRYADYLAETGRYYQGVQLLKDFQASHSDLQPWQESNILMSLAQIARNHGEKDLADQYQQAAMEKQRTGTAPQTSPRQVIGPEMQQAQKAVSEGNLDEAVNLTLDAIASASTAPDGDQIAWQAPNVAAQLSGRKAAEKGEQIFRALFPVLEARAVDNPGALNQALQQYARFLIGRKDRAGDAALAIDRYRDGVAASLGPESDGMIQVQHLRIELAQNQGCSEEAAQRAEELLTLEESLSGSTSTPYLDAAQTAVNVYQSSRKIERVLALHRQIVAIADLTYRPNDAQRGYLRMNAAMAYAMARQFDEAERLANEAIALGQSMRPPRTNEYRAQAEQIQKMKANAPGAAQGRTSVVVTPSGQWLVRDRWLSNAETKPPESPRP